MPEEEIFCYGTSRYWKIPRIHTTERRKPKAIGSFNANGQAVHAKNHASHDSRVDRRPFPGAWWANMMCMQASLHS